MELVNEFIFLKTNVENTIYETICIAKKDTFYVYLTYTLKENECFFEFTNTFNKIEIKIATPFFEKYNKPFDITLEKQPICCNTQSKLFDLIQCKLIGIERSLYLESIIIYLLYQVQKNNLIFQLNCDTCSFLNKPVEKEKIQKAKEFILNNLDKNITIPQIAIFVGTNQCYLKKGFKEIFNQTIFEFLQENRMEKAKHLLSNSNKSIIDICYEVGYSSVSSFSQSYKNYFGISPSVEQKKFS